MSVSPRAWLIRAGSRGEREDFVLENGIAGVGFENVSDLTAATDRDQVKTIVRAGYPGAKEGNGHELREPALVLAFSGQARRFGGASAEEEFADRTRPRDPRIRVPGRRNFGLSAPCLGGLEKN